MATYYCVAGRIDGTTKIGNLRLIPKDAENLPTGGERNNHLISCNHIPKVMQYYMDVYGMAEWVAEDLTFDPSVYRYLMVVNVRGIEGDTYPAVLNAEFETAN